MKSSSFFVALALSSSAIAHAAPLPKPGWVTIKGFFKGLGGGRSGASVTPVSPPEAIEDYTGMVGSHPPPNSPDASPPRSPGASPSHSQESSPAESPQRAHTPPHDQGHISHPSAPPYPHDEGHSSYGSDRPPYPLSESGPSGLMIPTRESAAAKSDPYIGMVHEGPYPGYRYPIPDADWSGRYPAYVPYEPPHPQFHNPEHHVPQNQYPPLPYSEPHHYPYYPLEGQYPAYPHFAGAQAPPAYTPPRFTESDTFSHQSWMPQSEYGGSASGYHNNHARKSPHFQLLPSMIS